MPFDTVSELRADCSQCIGLCCVALPLTRSADFPVDKAAGSPCPHLTGADRCGIHDQLRSRGYLGCTVFDCFGAGQRVTARYTGRTWRNDPETAATFFSAFGAARQLAEMRWYLTEVLVMSAAGPFHERATELDAETLRLLDSEPGQAVIDRHRGRVSELLQGAAALVRDQSAHALGVSPRDRPGADLVGAQLAGADLRSCDLRGSLLLGADLSGADLTAATLLGADLRGADLRGTQAAGAFLLTSPQVAAARGDATTTLPARIVRPTHWAG